MKAALSVLITLSILFFSFDLPDGWIRLGSSPESYEMGIEKGSGYDGGNAATIKSINKRIKGFGTLMQQSRPDKFLGKRVRMSGYLKTQDVKSWAGFWMRVDSKTSSKSLSFDNMNDRNISGTTDWKKYEIVLDVPEGSSLIAFGALIEGTGQIWFDDIQFEIVDDTVPITGLFLKGSPYPTHDEPVNLGFE